MFGLKMSNPQPAQATINIHTMEGGVREGSGGELKKRDVCRARQQRAYLTIHSEACGYLASVILVGVIRVL